MAEVKEQDGREKTLDEQLGTLNHSLESLTKILAYKLNPQAQPPVIQEMVLAQRHMEDAYDRIERARKQLNKKGTENAET